MTNRYNGIALIFDHSIREDDLEKMKELLLNIKHVIKVEPMGGDFDVECARMQVRNELSQKLWKVLYD